ncbi:DUF397 domain-containing protein [Streptomyces sp. NPDC052164]|uniref:DUF397 domain-containing protein n=1 Tax=unclassified Streptomyces TaxID=2593676 RepID=UPI003449E15F
MIRKPPAGAVSALEWFKSSYSSSGDGNDCVEVATTPVAVHVRDSKNAHGPRLAVSRAAWTGFVPYAAGH